MTRPRVLQVIGDTDLIPAHSAVIELHNALSESGFAVRTLALAPGRVGGLESSVPAVAHGRRTVAARTQVNHERRWADVTVLHGERALVWTTVPRAHDTIPVVVGLWDPARPRILAEQRSAAGRIIGRCARVVESDPSDVDPTAWASVLRGVLA